MSPGVSKRKPTPVTVRAPVVMDTRRFSKEGCGLREEGGVRTARGRRAGQGGCNQEVGGDTRKWAGTQGSVHGVCL